MLFQTNLHLRLQQLDHGYDDRDDSMEPKHYNDRTDIMVIITMTGMIVWLALR